MANNQNNVKRDGSKKGGGGKTVAAVAIAALLLGGGGYYGLSGDGMGFLPNHSGVVDPGSPDVITTAEPASDVTTKSEQDEKEKKHVKHREHPVAAPFVQTGAGRSILFLHIVRLLYHSPTPDILLLSAVAVMTSAKLMTELNRPTAAPKLQSP